MRIIIISILLFNCGTLSAQTFNEWFQQKEAKKKYLLQQVAALKLYLSYAEKGYSIASSGLQAIHAIKKGDYKIHDDFFNALKEVNPALKNWGRVEDIIALQVKIVKQTKGVLSSIKEQNKFTAEEIDYCKTVFDQVLDDCLNEIQEVIDLTADGYFGMKDDERIQRIENIFLQMQDNYSFVSSFGDEMKALSIQRIRDQKEIELSGGLNK